MSKLVVSKATEEQVLEVIAARSGREKEAAFTQCALTRVPQVVCQLQNVKTLHLRGNHLTELPEEISLLLRLSTLNLDENCFVAIPKQVLKICSLKKLSLRSNYLAEVPDFISKLTTLTTLHVDDNRLVRVSPSLARCSAIKSVSGVCGRHLLCPSQVFSTKTWKRCKMALKEMSEVQRLSKQRLGGRFWATMMRKTPSADLLSDYMVNNMPSATDLHAPAPFPFQPFARAEAALTEHQNLRQYMEDRSDLKCYPLDSSAFPEQEGAFCGFFRPDSICFIGVYDGHGGDRVSQFLREHLIENVMIEWEKLVKQHLGADLGWRAKSSANQEDDVESDAHEKKRSWSTPSTPSPKRLPLKLGLLSRSGTPQRVSRKWSIGAPSSPTQKGSSREVMLSPRRGTHTGDGVPSGAKITPLPSPGITAAERCDSPNIRRSRHGSAGVVDTGEAVPPGSSSPMEMQRRGDHSIPLSGSPPGSGGKDRSPASECTQRVGARECSQTSGGVDEDVEGDGVREHEEIPARKTCPSGLNEGHRAKSSDSDEPSSGLDSPSSPSSSSSSRPRAQILLRRAMMNGFAETDRQLRELKGDAEWVDGSTAILVALFADSVFVANCGDCRAVLDRGGSFVALSRDHKASDPGEIKRVQEEGGEIITSNKVPRLHGKLAVTRAFGDYDLTALGGLSCVPEIRAMHLDPTKDVGLVIASDGLWDVIDNEGAIHHAGVAPNVGAGALHLMQLARERGSQDNITICVVRLYWDAEVIDDNHLLSKRASHRKGRTSVDVQSSVRENYTVKAGKASVLDKFGGAL